MNYTILHETRQSIRVRFQTGRWNKAEAEAVRRALAAAEGVEKIRIFPACGGVYLEHSGARAEAIAALDAVSPETLAADPYASDGCITIEEWKTRKLHPALKKQMQREILAEAAADLLLPAPAQFAYHAFQLAQLKNR